MFKNYFTIIIRNFGRNKMHTLINMIGLGVGIAAVVWGFQNYRYSFSYDHFHKNGKDIFRVLTKVKGSDNLRGGCPVPLARFAKNDFPVIKEAVRWESRGLNVKAAQGEPLESEAHFTEPAFFDVFNFPLVEGTQNLTDHSTVLITEKAAKKFFGTEDPVGKILTFYSDESFSKPLTVTGVLKDPPLNSSIQFELITHTDNQLTAEGSLIKNDDWKWFSDAVFVKLSNASEAPSLSKDLSKYLPMVDNARKDVQLVSFHLRPLSQLSDGFEIQSNALSVRPPDSASYGPLALAILILLSACLNFANTSVAQSNRRLKEMGVRKVMGSSLRQIILQQLLECAVVVLIAIGLSMLFNNFWLPVYNSMFNNVNVHANYLSDGILIAFLVSLLFGVTILAGVYPAFYISRFNTASIFRGSVKFGGSHLFSRILLGLQISISFITVIAGVAFSKNSTFQRNYDYGYEKANVIGVDLQSETAFTAVRNEFVKIPEIEQMTGTRSNIGFYYRWLPLDGNGEKKQSIFLEAGENYVDVMKLKLVAGRSFNKADQGDYGQSMLINENLAFQFGWRPEKAIGQQIRKNDTSMFTVVGVLKDFEQNTLFDPVQPVAMSLARPEKYSQIIIRAKQGYLSSVYNQAKASWAKLYPMKPFRGYYQDELSAQASSVNENIATIFSGFAIISMLMAATGMFALVSLTVLKRTREIAIRKVVGASGRHIFQLVMNGYILIFILSAGIGCYAGYALSRLLMDLIFRINAGVGISSLILSFIGVLLISTLTIGSRVWLVLRTKATEVLKGN
jgi:putative ABC transport system permease protein